MRSMILAGALVAMAGTGVSAQVPAAAPAARGMPAAQMLLARTGELQLTDAQVVRLAAIARRGEARRQTMRASRDSMRARFAPGTRPDSATRAQMMQRFRADADRVREQNRADLRDAIAVLTPDQQARAWEMVANRGGQRGQRGAQRGQRGMQRGGQRGMQPRGMQPRPGAPDRP